MIKRVFRCRDDEKVWHWQLIQHGSVIVSGIGVDRDQAHRLACGQRFDIQQARRRRGW